MLSLHLRHSTIHRLPLETMQVIYSELETNSRTNMMCLDHHFLNMMVAIRYQTVVSRGPKFLNFFITLARRGPRSELYARHVRSITYRSVSSRFDIVVYPIICKALQMTRFLHILNIQVPRDSVEYANRCADRYDLVRTRVHPIKAYVRGSVKPMPPSPWLLPSLNTLCLGNGPALLPLSNYCLLTTLWINTPMDYIELDLVFECIGDTCATPALRMLGLCISKGLPPRQIITCLAHARPSLQLLSLMQNGISIRVSYINLSYVPYSHLYLVVT